MGVHPPAVPASRSCPREGRAGTHPTLPIPTLPSLCSPLFPLCHLPIAETSLPLLASPHGNAPSPFRHSPSRVLAKAGTHHLPSFPLPCPREGGDPSPSIVPLIAPCSPNHHSFPLLLQKNEYESPNQSISGTKSSKIAPIRLLNRINSRHKPWNRNPPNNSLFSRNNLPPMSFLTNPRISPSAPCDHPPFNCQLIDPIV